MRLSAFLCCALLGGCTSYLPGSGPATETLSRQAAAIRVVDIDDAVVRRMQGERAELFSDAFAATPPQGWQIGSGDVLEVTIWEAQPAALFGPATPDAHLPRATTLPEQMVNSRGTIGVPFAGQVAAAGRDPQQLEADIAARLKGKANQPQVLVRIIRNNTATVTVVGEVAASTRFALSAGGERLLDALAAAGGVRQSVAKTSVQLTRGGTVRALPLDTVIRDPRQNLLLRPGDVVTTLYQPLSFTVLGATGKNEEVGFEAQGISLAQALARAGGVQDARADPHGVFIFRREPAPVVYRMDLRQPAGFFLAQAFPVRHGDVLFVSNAPAVELQKFLGIVVAAVYPVANVVKLERD